MQNPDRQPTAVAALGAAFAGLVALMHPSLVPALTVALAAWMAFCAFLKI